MYTMKLFDLDMRWNIDNWSFICNIEFVIILSQNIHKKKIVEVKTSD